MFTFASYGAKIDEPFGSKLIHTVRSVGYKISDSSTRMNTRSIRFRLISRFAALLLLVMLAFGIFTYWSVRGYVVDVIGASMTHRARQIAQTLLASGQIDESYVANEIETRYAPESNDRFIRITRADGTVLYCSRTPADRSFTPSNVPHPLARTAHAGVARGAVCEVKPRC